jgi:hypothetical protein
MLHLENKPVFLAMCGCCVVVPVLLTLLELKLMFTYDGVRPFNTWAVSEAISLYWLLSLGLLLIGCIYVNYNYKATRLSTLAECFAVGLIISIEAQCLLPIYATKPLQWLYWLYAN